MLKVLYSLSIISGTVIGAGLFALPYLVLKVGPLVILGYFIVLGLIVILIHYFFGELALVTRDFIRIPGFARHYLGEWGYRISLTTGILGLFGACLAYLIIGGKFLSAVASPYFGGGEGEYTLLYFIAGAALIFFGIKAIGKVQFLGLILFFLALGGIFFIGRPHLDISNLFITEIDKAYIFAPYGIILFSLWGLALIPEAEEVLGDKRHLLKKIIPIAIIIPILVYLFFIALILGITGVHTTEDALVGLQNFLGDGVVLTVLLFGVLTTFTSFIAIGLTLKKIFWYDLQFGKNFSWALTCFIPISFYFLGFTDFIRVLTVVGGVMLAVDGILVMLMYQKIKPISIRVFTYPIIFALLLGIIYELIYSLRIL